MKRAVILVVIATMLAACGAPSPISAVVPSPPATSVSARSVIPITAETAPHLSKIAQFSLPDAGPSLPDAGPVGGLAFTPDNAELRAVYGKQFALRHWRVADGALLDERPIEPVGMGAIAFDSAARVFVTSGAGDSDFLGDRYMAGSSPDEILGPLDGPYLVDTQNGHRRQLRYPEPQNTSFNGVALGQDGQTMVVAGKGDKLVVWRLPEQGPPPDPVFERPISTASNVYLSDLALGPQGRLLAARGEGNQIQLWDVKSGREWGALSLEQGEDNQANGRGMDVARIAIDPARRWLAAFWQQREGQRTRRLTLWQLDERRIRWQLTFELPMAESYIYTLAFDPSSMLLVAGMSSGVRIWHVETGEELLTIPGQYVYAVAFSADSSLLTWGDDAGVIHIAGVSER